ncbi:hypothetical protein Ssi03_62710 [Sphaerisporangium siamense]|uniref:Uncharacterized protein n=1 Tax=Sphaerisporangium siamense TaxID=795645 RepID=A0A7W7GBM3_9ACTN|nr:hypothetical protein [Sphaerisporangium siamense]MBB4702579.1 hypothetical protein [Sphaerisporangium siamense]GII88281.1 hypothetical protein Ssi03_62710 [Sphaerisporangium siamense]
METAWIKHPRIDDGQRVIEVPESAVPHHQRAGWERTDPPPPPPEDDPQDEAPADAGASALKDPDQTPRRRRTTSRGDD